MSEKLNINSSPQLEVEEAKEDSESKVKEKVEESNIEVFDKQDYIENSEALGYPNYVVIGALFNSAKEKISTEEFNVLVREFLYGE